MIVFFSASGHYTLLKYILRSRQWTPMTLKKLEIVESGNVFLSSFLMNLAAIIHLSLSYDRGELHSGYLSLLHSHKSNPLCASWTLRANTMFVDVINITIIRNNRHSNKKKIISYDKSNLKKLKRKSLFPLSLSPAKVQVKPTLLAL